MSWIENWFTNKKEKEISEQIQILTFRYNRLQKDYDEIWESQTTVEFILGDRETGWVWTEMIKDYEKLAIGSEVVLFGENESANIYIIEQFDEWNKKYRHISFYIKKWQDVPTTGE